MNLEKLDTEKRNAATENLDTMSVMDILRVMNNEDKHVLEAVRQNSSDRTGSRVMLFSFA